MQPPAQTARAYSYLEVGPLLRELEERRALLRHTFDGWSIWPLFRMQVAMALLDPQATPKGGGSGGQFSRKEMVRLALGDMMAWCSAPRGIRALMVTCSSYRTDTEEGRPKDTMFDDYGRRLGDVFKFERINNRRLFELNAQSVLPSRMTNSLMTLLQRLCARLPVPAAARSAAEALVADIAGTPAARVLTTEVVARRLAAFRHGRRQWRSLCRRVRPRVVLIDDGCYQHDLMAGAKEAGVWVMELQHGTFTPEGPEYCWSRAALAHREQMPVPDRFLVFGEHWRGLLEADGFWTDRVSIVGSTRIDLHRKVSRFEKRAHPGLVMLVTTQGVAREELVRWIQEVMRALKDQPAFRVIVKLHPGYDHDPAPYQSALGNDRRVVVQPGTEGPTTFERLLEADLHASISSSCHFDSLALGTPTVILGLPSHEYVLNILESGHAALARSPQEWADVVRATTGARVPEAVGHHYFRAGAAENLAEAVTEIESTSRSSRHV